MLFCALLAAVMGISPAQAQNGAGSTKAQLSASIILTKNADLFFGDITPGTSGGTVTIQAQTGARTTAGGVIAVGGSSSRAKFTGIGSAGRVVTFTMTPSPSLTLNRVGGGATMTVNQLRASINGGNSGPLAPNFTLPANGTVEINVGGRLNVGANQMQGVYTANITFTMNYQ
jgi:hypothetical protein